jgi:uncharacterized OB-fold protein
MTEIICSNCGAKSTTKNEICDSCGQKLVEKVEKSKKEKSPEKEKKASKKEIKRVIVSKDDWEEHREKIEGERATPKRQARIPQQVFCPECGKAHESESKFCQYCGYDLEAAILRYKNKRLPIKYDVDEERPRRAKAGVYVLVYLVVLTMSAIVVGLGVFTFGRNSDKIWGYVLFGLAVIVYIIVYFLSYPYLPSRSGCYGSGYRSSSCSSSSCDACGDACGGACQNCDACGGECQDCGDCFDCL